MPYLFLSPSTQEFNPYVTTQNEEYWMNLLADRMEPYLLASGIGFTRNDPDQNAAAAIRQSNAGTYDFHLALHSNAAPPEKSGQFRGVDFYYYPSSAQGLRMAEILTEEIRKIYPLPELVQPRPTTLIGEVRRTKAPSVLAELGYHDNPEDAQWIEDNLDRIAQALVRGVCEYFGVPFIEPSPVQKGIVTVSWGSLNIRDLPDLNAAVLTSAPGGAELTVYGVSGNWYSVSYRGIVGYASTAFVVLQ
ncbi:MAG TPA: N-acetylmuramoyl-L-alanine amidase [Candidatus Avoscillospira stercoripullorum]|uniref:N-acetylmuramoyl-L-alanine amidase n=1 Tax=Candidatus Avoscillospira stercoripullorum TaxID=2840709 RepID=A0A9D1A747_9FIRM|nr:N-acetylmuramoyl-L-alanine amidase [Candidatus Avoscillospira stercoripullorum]